MFAFLFFITIDLNVFVVQKWLRKKIFRIMSVLIICFVQIQKARKSVITCTNRKYTKCIRKLNIARK